jgi:AraC-like DNA-binding protein
LPIADVARRIGFDDPLCLSKIFKRDMGMTAREYRRRHAIGDAIMATRNAIGGP